MKTLYFAIAVIVLLAGSVFAGDKYVPKSLYGNMYATGDTAIVSGLRSPVASINHKLVFIKKGDIIEITIKSLYGHQVKAIKAKTSINLKDSTRNVIGWEDYDNYTKKDIQFNGCYHQYIFQSLSGYEVSITRELKVINAVNYYRHRDMNGNCIPITDALFFD